MKKDRRKRFGYLNRDYLSKFVKEGNLTTELENPAKQKISVFVCRGLLEAIL